MSRWKVFFKKVQT